MARFQYQKKPNTYRKFVFSACIFLLVVFLFYQGITSLSQSTKRRQKEALENALNRDITCCYALEGAYPGSLKYLKQHYGLTYDESRFFVDYKVSGANLLPDVTIIEKGE